MRVPRLAQSCGVGLLVGVAWIPSRGSAQEQVATVSAKTPPPQFTTVSDAMLKDARSDGGKNWLMYGRDYSDQRWSPLTQVRTTTVHALRLSWMYQTGISRLGSFETTPVVVNGIMYLTTPYNTAMAVDARTGKEIWRYEHKLGTTIFCCGPNNRGMGVSGNTVYMLTLDARLVALDAQTGKVKFDVEIADPEAGYSETHAPIIVGNKVLVGISGAEYGIRGFVRAYDKNTGDIIWTTYTIPDNGWEGRFVEKTWEGDYSLNRNVAQEKADLAAHSDAWQRGGGSVWMNAAVDEATSTMYVASGNPSPDLDGSLRPGDNLYTDCILALDINTGAIKWYYQEVPHDVWDLDAVSPPVLVTLRNGQKAVAQAGKSAWVYILDAGTGKLIRKSAPFDKQENMFAQPTADGARMLPGANGGSEWSPISVDPNLGYAYVAGLEQPMHYITHSAPLTKGQLWLGSAFKAIADEPQWGTFTAIDLNTGKIAWQDKMDQPMMGGSLATAGGLVFTGEGNGRFDAFDAHTGKLLWHFTGGAGCNAAPMTYMLDGTQYIAVACGGNFQLGYPLGDAVLVFAVPRTEGGEPPHTISQSGGYFQSEPLMKRFAGVVAVLGLTTAVCIAPAARAQLTMQMSNGWSLSFSGDVDAFLTYQFSNNTDDASINGGLVPVGQGDYARIRTGLLPGFAVFDVKGKEGNTDIGVHFGFAPQIQSAGTHDQFGAQIDMRQVYLTIGGSWGQILAGREIGLYQRQNILTDMTLFGTGAFGGSLGAGGTTLGRIGYGYIYPNFNAQITYSTPATNPWQWSIGLFDPSFIGSSDSGLNASLKYTPYPRVETEFTYTGKFHQNADKTSTDQVMLWVGGLWQDTYANPGDTGLSVTSDGVDGGVKLDVSKLSLVASGYYGQGLGTTLMLSGPLSTDSAGNARKSYGYILQAVYKLCPKWSLGASWGQSILDATPTDETDTSAPTLLKANSMIVGTVVYQVTKSLKWVGEYDWTQAANHSGGINRVDQAASGFMVFF